MRQALRNCPICSHDRVDVLHSQKFALPEAHPLTDGYDIVCCSNCGFVYADTAASQEAYDRFYTEHSKYEDGKTATGGVDNRWDRERQADTAKQISDLLNNPSCSILDVGCANGGLLRSLKDFGYTHVFGIDPSPACVENTRKLGVDAEIGSLFQTLSLEPFDCVVLSHTLEHVQDLARAAKWIRTTLKENGRLYIEVPDAEQYTDFVDAPFQDFNIEHINHFSLTSLQNYMKRSGFEPLESGRKVIPASANKPYPATYCFAVKQENSIDITQDAVLRPAIENYITRSRDILNNIEVRLNAALSTARRVIVWGTGQLAMKLLIETSLAQAEILAFVDSNPINQGKILRGTPVIAPEAIYRFTEPILISSTLHQKSIVEQIEKMGLRNPLILLKD